MLVKLVPVFGKAFWIGSAAALLLAAYGIGSANTEAGFLGFVQLAEVGCFLLVGGFICHIRR